MALTITRAPATSDVPVLFGFLVACQVAGMLGLTITYAELHELRSTPTGDPTAALGSGLVMKMSCMLAWITMHGLVAFAGYKIWRARRSVHRRVALRAFALQLLLPILWGGVMFGLHQPGWAIVVLAGTIAAMIATALHTVHFSRTGALLFAPIVLATSYALVLNISVWRMGIIP